MSGPSAREIAAGLTKAQREAWIRTVLAVSESEANRRAFIAGYNGELCPPPRTEKKSRYYERGLEVRRILTEESNAR